MSKNLRVNSVCTYAYNIYIYTYIYIYAHTCNCSPDVGKIKAFWATSKSFGPFLLHTVGVYIQIHIHSHCQDTFGLVVEVGVKHEAAGHDQEVQQQDGSRNLHIPKSVHAKPQRATRWFVCSYLDLFKSKPYVTISYTRSKPVSTYLDLQNAQNDGSHTAYSLYFGILGHSVGGPGSSRHAQRIVADMRPVTKPGPPQRMGGANCKPANVGWAASSQLRPSLGPLKPAVEAIESVISLGL